MTSFATFTALGGWLVAGAVFAGSMEFGSINALITKGVTVGRVATAALSALGTIVMTNPAIAAMGSR